jgi:beta-lactamase class D
MLFENNNLYKLSYKTGLGRNENGTMVAWIIGWIEENKHPYFFVLNLESEETSADIFSVRMKILKDILSNLGFMQGKK